MPYSYPRGRLKVVEQIMDKIKIAIQDIAMEAFRDTVELAWDSSEGYDSSGNSVEWTPLSELYKLDTGRTEPALDDTGNLRGSVEIEWYNNGWGYRFVVNNTDTSPYRQTNNPGKRGGKGYPVHAKNLSGWHYDDRPHLGISEIYNFPGGSEATRLFLEAIGESIDDLIASGDIVEEQVR
tara:strand:- start:235 stop:774 length:540 start_codon:yes stop_codon:yes gene_type:complete